MKLPRSLMVAIPLVLFTGLLYATGVLGDLPIILSLLLAVAGLWRALKGKMRVSFPGKNILLFTLLFLAPYFAGWAIVVATEPAPTADPSQASAAGTVCGAGTCHEVGVGHSVEVAAGRVWAGFIPLTSEFGFVLPYHVLYTVLSVGFAVGLSRRVTVA